jgi:hypothetical protein
MARATFGRRTKPPTPPISSQFIERRRHPREHVYSPARVVADDETGTDCIIRDISESGAGLRFADAVDLPRRFVLCAEDGIGRLCRLIWQSDFDAGVEFEGATAAC